MVAFDPFLVLLLVLFLLLCFSHLFLLSFVLTMVVDVAISSQNLQISRFSLKSAETCEFDVCLLFLLLGIPRDPY